MNNHGCQARREEIAALLAVMTPGENYTTDALAARLGWSLPATRAMIHAAEGTCRLWQHRQTCKGPRLWVRREYRRDASAGPAWPPGELQGYEREWRTFRDLCMLVRHT